MDATPNGAAVKVIAYSPPASPTAPAAATATDNAASSVNLPAVVVDIHNNNDAHSISVSASSYSTLSAQSNSSSPASGTTSTRRSDLVSTATINPIMTVTPKKDLLSAVVLATIRASTPGAACELQALAFEQSEIDQAIKLIKGRYLISAQPCHNSVATATKSPASYRHLIDLTSSNLKCLDIFTGDEYLCKIINEPLHKVQRAYFQLQQDEELCHSYIYGHSLIRGVHDIVSLSSVRTYIIVAPVKDSRDSSGISMGVYENLHTYIRNQKRIGEIEARTLFHQICQTVQVCHRNGIILRDLKLKRFYFIDEARTKLQYQSLEGSMILDNPADDTLSDKIGCPLYTAPELLCQNPTYQGKPADMWSLGVILYTMLVGQYPFYEKANCNLITIIRHGNVQIPTTLSKSVRWLLLALLRKNYGERLTAAHIFLAPWLKEQRPFYTYLPVNVEIMEEDEEDTNCFGTKVGEKTCLLASDSGDENMGVQPLDYTHSTLQMELQLATTPSVETI